MPGRMLPESISSLAWQSESRSRSRHLTSTSGSRSSAECKTGYPVCKLENSITSNNISTLCKGKCYKAKKVFNHAFELLSTIYIFSDYDSNTFPAKVINNFSVVVEDNSFKPPYSPLTLERFFSFHMNSLMISGLC